MTQALPGQLHDLEEIRDVQSNHLGSQVLAVPGREVRKQMQLRQAARWGFHLGVVKPHTLSKRKSHSSVGGGRLS